MMNTGSYQQARLSRDKRFDGRFFVAVKSTGIFCRNICPAKTPKEENVEYFDCAAQALTSGYRPCLRCRPDSAPQSFAWLGAETTLIRTMKLLKEFPEQSLQTIAQRVGVSDSYLRRMFRQRIGISPKQYQLSEQLLFAKKLLHESQLTIEQVAANAGFGSARRLQENLKKMMNLTPSQIRSERQVLHPFIQVYLSFTPPYNWQQVRDFLALRAARGIELVTEDGYARNFAWAGTQGAFKALYEHNESRFKVHIALEDVAKLRAVIANIRRVLDVDLDIHRVQAKLLETGLAESQMVTGVRLPGVWSQFEAVTRAVLGQQVSIKAAINQVNNLVAHIGQHYNNPLGLAELNRQFPQPQEIADGPVDFLKMPGARKTALQQLAQYIAAHPSNPPEDWLAVKGIGPWTIDYAKMRGLSDPDIWLGGDLVIKKQIQQYALQEQQAAPWRSYLTYQLWTLAS
ncbi:MAG: Ada metal-binding domain-containing protein [Aestuariibacter sp.]